jgi:ankyrin repeat protein
MFTNYIQFNEIEFKNFLSTQECTFDEVKEDTKGFYVFTAEKPYGMISQEAPKRIQAILEKKGFSTPDVEILTREMEWEGLHMAFEYVQVKIPKVEFLKQFNPNSSNSTNLSDLQKTDINGAIESVILTLPNEEQLLLINYLLSDGKSLETVENSAAVMEALAEIMEAGYLNSQTWLSKEFFRKKQTPGTADPTPEQMAAAVVEMLYRQKSALGEQSTTFRKDTFVHDAFNDKTISKQDSLDQELFKAIEKSELETLKEALDQGVPIDKKYSPYGGTLLSYAVVMGKADVVNFLLEEGADPNVIDNNDNTPLAWAILKGDLPDNQQINQPVSDRFITTAIKQGTVFISIIKDLLNAGSRILQKDKKGDTAHSLISKKVIASEIFNKITQNMGYEAGQNELIQALISKAVGSKDFVQIIRILRTQSENPESVTSLVNFKFEETSLLNLAIQAGNFKAVKSLVQLGADPNSQKPLTHALALAYNHRYTTKDKYLDIAKFLLQNSAKFDDDDINLLYKLYPDVPEDLLDLMPMDPAKRPITRDQATEAKQKIQSLTQLEFVLRETPPLGFVLQHSETFHSMEHDERLDKIKKAFNVDHNLGILTETQGLNQGWRKITLTVPFEAIPQIATNDFSILQAKLKQKQQEDQQLLDLQKKQAAEQKAQQALNLKKTEMLAKNTLSILSGIFGEEEWNLVAEQEGYVLEHLIGFKEESIVFQKSNRLDAINHILGTKLDLKPVPTSRGSIAYRLVLNEQDMLGIQSAQKQNTLNTRLDLEIANIWNSNQEPNLYEVIKLVTTDPNLLNKKFEYMGATPLSLAAVKGDLTAVKLLLSLGANVNLQDNNKNVPLAIMLWDIKKAMEKTGLYPENFAIYKEIAVLLMNAGTDIKLRNQANFSVKQGIEARYEWKEELLAIAQKGIKPIHEQLALVATETVTIHKLWNSSLPPDLNSVMNLINKNPGLVNKPFAFNGIYPLHLAAYHDNPSAVELLIKLGADINAQDLQGNTPLASLYWSNKTNLKEHRFETANFLIAGTDLDQEDSQGYSLNKLVQVENGDLATYIKQGGEKPVDTSIFNTHEKPKLTEVLHIVKSNKQLVNQTFDNYYKASPLSLAVVTGNLEAVKLLLKLGADVNQVDGNGNTALASLFWHVGKYNIKDEEKHQYIEIAKLLLDRGTDIQKKDNGGLSVETQIFRALTENNHPKEWVASPLIFRTSFEAWLKENYQVIDKNENTQKSGTIRQGVYINYLFESEVKALAFAEDFGLNPHPSRFACKGSNKTVFWDRASKKYAVLINQDDHKKIKNIYLENTSNSRLQVEKAIHTHLIQSRIQKLSFAQAPTLLNKQASLASNNATGGWFASQATVAFHMSIDNYMALHRDSLNSQEYSDLQKFKHRLLNDSFECSFGTLGADAEFVRKYLNDDPMLEKDADSKVQQLEKENEIVIEAGGMSTHRAIIKIWKVGINANGYQVQGQEVPVSYAYFQTEYNAGAGADWAEYPRFNPESGHRTTGIIWKTSTREINPHMIRNLIIAQRQITRYQEPQQPWMTTRPEGYSEPNSLEACHWQTCKNNIENCLGPRYDLLSKKGIPQVSGNCTLMSLKVYCDDHVGTRLSDEVWRFTKEANYDTTMSAMKDKVTALGYTPHVISSNASSFNPDFSTGPNPSQGNIMGNMPSVELHASEQKAPPNAIPEQKAAELEAQRVAEQKAAELEAQRVAEQKAAELEAQRVAEQKAAELEAQRAAEQIEEPKWIDEILNESAEQEDPYLNAVLTAYAKADWSIFEANTTHTGLHQISKIAKDNVLSDNAKWDEIQKIAQKRIGTLMTFKSEIKFLGAGRHHAVHQFYKELVNANTYNDAPAFPLVNKDSGKAVGHNDHLWYQCFNNTKETIINSIKSLNLTSNHGGLNKLIQIAKGNESTESTFEQLINKASSNSDSIASIVRYISRSCFFSPKEKVKEEVLLLYRALSQYNTNVFWYPKQIVDLPSLLLAQQKREAIIELKALRSEVDSAKLPALESLIKLLRVDEPKSVPDILHQGDPNVIAIESNCGRKVAAVFNSLRQIHDLNAVLPPQTIPIR